VREPALARAAPDGEDGDAFDRLEPAGDRRCRRVFRKGRGTESKERGEEEGKRKGKGKGTGAVKGKGKARTARAAASGRRSVGTGMEFSSRCFRSGPLQHTPGAGPLSRLGHGDCTLRTSPVLRRRAVPPATELLEQGDQVHRGRSPR